MLISSCRTARTPTCAATSFALLKAWTFATVNTSGGAAHDRLQWLECFSKLMPVGFYYKAFHTPKWLFPFYEKRLRQAAGLGHMNPDNPFVPTPKDYAFCDVLVVGAGPAGLSAAVAAGECGARVILVDEHPHPGGTLQFQHARDAQGKAALESLIEKVSALDNVELRTSTTAVSHDSDNWVALMSGAALTKVRARTVVMATGCYEQPAVFRNNDLPGVMMASAAQRLIHLFAVKPFNTGGRTGRQHRRIPRGVEPVGGGCRSIRGCRSAARWRRFSLGSGNRGRRG